MARSPAPRLAPTARSDRHDPPRADRAVHGYVIAKDGYQMRLRRIEGQVRGLQRMIDEDRDCVDIIHQVAAARAALESVAIGLVDQHVRHCVMAATDGGGQERDTVLAEAITAVERLVKS